MGIVSMTMPCTRPPCGHFLDKPVPRLERVSVLEVIKNGGIPLLNYVASEPTGFSPVKPMQQLHCPPVTQQTIKLNMVWHSGWFFSGADNPRPNWSGFM